MAKKTIVSLILLAVLGLSQGCAKIKPGNTQDGTGEAIKTKVGIAMTTRSTGYFQAVGTVKAEMATTISGKLMGVIKAVNVRAGDTVKKGQVMILIDDRQVDAQLKQAKAAMEEALRSQAAAASARDAAKAGAQLAQSTYGRYQKLIEDNAASRQEFEEVEMRFNQAEASLKQADEVLEAAKERVKEAEAGVQSAGVSMHDAEIKAPYDGIVTARMADVGDLSSPGVQLLNIEKSGALEVDAIIPEDYINFIALRQVLDVTMPVLQERRIQAKVRSIIMAADPQSRTFTIKLDIPETEGIHSGMFVRINIPGQGEDRLVIPSSALVRQGQLTGLFVVDDEKKAHFRIVRTGRKTGDLVEVISGIKDGTIYVLSPPVDLKEGMKVEGSS